MTDDRSNHYSDRLLVTGAAGFLGRHVCRRAVAAGYAIVGTYRTARADVSGVDWVPADVTDAIAIDALIEATRPDAIVHTAIGLAGSLVPSAAQRNWITNAVAPVHIARASARRGIRLVHISSDAVHRGRDEPYGDAVPPDPVYSYGAAKAAAELAVATVAPEAVIVRVPPIMSGGGDDLADRERFMLDLASRRLDGVLFTDEMRCPIAANDLADACLELAANDVRGLLNVAGSDVMSWYDMGRIVVAKHGGDPDALPAGTHASTHITRPGRVVLDTTRARSVLRTRLRGLREAYADASDSADSVAVPIQ
jgi:dTDP-4-dehydrorhamnose reductase